MAIDPRITSGIRVPDAGNVIAKFNQNMQNNAEQKRIAELHPLRVQQVEQAVDANQQSLNQNRDNQRLLRIHQTGQRLKPLLDAGDTQGAQNFLLDNISSLQSRIEAGEDLDITESMETLVKLQAGDATGVLADINAVSGLVGGSGNISASQKEFDSALLMAQDPEATEFERNSAKRKLGGMARVSNSAQERIAADQSVTNSVADSQATITKAVTLAAEEVKTKESGRRGAITKAVNFASESNNKISGLTDLNSTYTDAIQQLDNGVDTGVIYNMLPSFDSNAMILDNIASQAGFNLAKSGGGIITEADMDWGMRTAIPQNLPPKELKEFLQKKQSAQSKIIANLKEVTMFLGDGTKTLPDWYRSQKGSINIKKLSDEELFR